MLREYSQIHPGKYYLEVSIGERRIDAVRIAAPYTAFFPGADLRLDSKSKDGAAIEAIEVKQGALRRNIIDQAIGSAKAVGAIPVAIVEVVPEALVEDIVSRYPTFKVWASRRSG
jgi:predicted RecB family endonuclease